jgi:heme-degrading monooxygenase HmoA
MGASSLCVGPRGVFCAIWFARQKTKANMAQNHFWCNHMRVSGAGCGAWAWGGGKIISQFAGAWTKLRKSREEPMPNISKEAELQTVITTFEMTPGTCQDLLDALTDAYDQFISKQPGFIAAGLHVNDAQTRIANYSQWRRREDFQAMLRSEEMRERNRKINQLCRSFEPVMYDVLQAYD